MRRVVEDKSSADEIDNKPPDCLHGKDTEKQKILEDNGFMRFSRNILIKIHRMSLAFFDFSCIISLD